MGMIVEGVSTTKAAYELAQQSRSPEITEIYNVCTMTKMYNKQQRNHVARWQNRKRIYT